MSIICNFWHLNENLSKMEPHDRNRPFTQLPPLPRRQRRIWMKTCARNSSRRTGGLPSWRDWHRHCRTNPCLWIRLPSGRRKPVAPLRSSLRRTTSCTGLSLIRKAIIWTVRPRKSFITGRHSGRGSKISNTREHWPWMPSSTFTAKLSVHGTESARFNTELMDILSDWFLKQEQQVRNNVRVTDLPDTNRGAGVSGLAVLLQPSLLSTLKGLSHNQDFFLSLWCHWGEKFPG